MKKVTIKVNLLVLATVFLVSCAPKSVVNTGYDKLKKQLIDKKFAEVK